MTTQTLKLGMKQKIEAPARTPAQTTSSLDSLTILICIGIILYGFGAMVGIFPSLGPWPYWNH